MNKFGIQFQWDSGEALRYNREVKPSAVMGIEVDKVEFYQRIIEENPDVGVIWRHHPNRPWAEDPERQAAEAVSHIASRIGHLIERGLIRWVTDNNEYVLGPDHTPADLIMRGDRYMAAFIRCARQTLGVGVCWGNFNTGHWGAETVDFFPNALAAAEQDGDSPICWHEYNWPQISDPGFWTCGKILRAMPPILAKYPKMRCMVTEFGVDDGGDPHRGWQLAHPDFGTAIQMFCDGICWCDENVVAVAPWLVAMLFFGCGMVSPWGSFDIAGCDEIFNTVRSLQSSPNGGNGMGIKVIDLDYQERDFEYAREKYGVAFRRAEVAPGQKVYRLVELWEKTGPTALITQVLDDDGRPMANVDVAFYWRDAPSPPDPPTKVEVHDWYGNFVHGATNVNGDVGPSMGPGAYHGRGEGGPHAVWVRDPNIPSDICEKLGMLAGTPHDHLDQKFKLMVEPEEGGQPGPGPEPGGELEIKGSPLEEPWESNMLYIAWPADLAVGADVHATSPTSEDHDTTPLEKWEHEGRQYVIGGVCGSFEGDAPREYWIWAYRLPDPADWITPTAKCEFEPLGQMATRKVTVVVDYKESPGPGPGPGPEPPSVSMADLHRRIADHHAGIAELHERMAKLHEGGGR